MKAILRRSFFTCAFLISALGYSGIAIAAIDSVNCDASGTTLDVKPEKVISDKIIEAFSHTTSLSPEFLAKADSRELAEMLVRRVHLLCDSLRAPRSQKLREDSQVVMLFPVANLSGLKNFGIRNVHETMKTGGAAVFEDRYALETGIVEMGFPYNEAGRKLAPKYAFQMIRSAQKMDIDPSTLRQYGNAIIRFKPSVNKRSTWTPVESLGIGMNTGPGSVEGAGFPLQTNFTKNEGHADCNPYCEAQVYGELDLSDVESIAVPDSTKLDDNLKSLGVRIETYHPTQMFDRFKADARSLVGKSDDRIPLNGLTVDSNPLYQPTAPPTSPEYKKWSQEKLNEVASADPNSAVSHLASEEVLRRMDVPQLLAAIEKEPNNKRESLTSRRPRLLAELSNHSDNPKALEVLRNAYDGGSVVSKTMALPGLEKLPPAEFKARLLDALKPGGPDEFLTYMLNRIAFFIALKYRNDPEILAAIKNVPGLRPLYHQFIEGPFCTPEKRR